jgi:hypothetical protein
MTSLTIRSAVVGLFLAALGMAALFALAQFIAVTWGPFG